MLAPAVVALLVIGQPSFVQLLPPGEPVAVKADLLHVDRGKEGSIYTGQRADPNGECWVRSSRAYLKADKITYDESTGVAIAVGNAIAVSGLSAAAADALEVNLLTGQMDVTTGTFMGKKGVTPAQLEAASTTLALERVGSTTFVAKGPRIRKLGQDELLVEGVEMTPCDCDPLKPHWGIKSFRADVVMGDHAWLWLPVVYVYKVPVLALPVLYVPLLDRKSGLLVTKPHFSAQSGFGLEQPVFFTLGRSYDMTVSPGFYLGNPPFTTPGNSRYFFGLAGPTLGLNFRYVPSTHVTGELTLSLVDDRRATRVPIAQLDPDSLSYLGGQDAAAIDSARKPHRGIRGTLSWRDERDFGNGLHSRVDASLLSDGYLVQDVTTDVLQRSNEYIRSTARLFRATDESYTGADVTVRQDVRYGYSFLPFADQGNWPIPQLRTHAPDTLQRLPGFTALLPETRLWGPLHGGMGVSFTRLAGLNGESENDAPYNQFVPYNPILLGIYPKGTQTPLASNTAVFPPRLLLPGEFPEIGSGEARDRLDLHPTVSAAWGSPFLQIRPYAALREDLYVGEVDGQVAQRGYLLGGIQLSSELSRVFASAGGPIRHAIAPSLDFRYVPFVLGAPLNTYDEIDRAIPYNPLSPNESQGLTQAVAQVSTTLMQRQGNLGVELLKLNVGQDVDLRQSGMLADGFAQLRARVGRVTAELMARMDTPSARLTQASAALKWADLRGDGVDFRYDGALLGGSERQRAGMDALVGLPYPDEATLRALPFAHQVHVGASAGLFAGLSVRYDVLLQTPGASLQIPSLPPAATFPSTSLNLSQQYIALGFAPACQCWKVEIASFFLPQASGGKVNPFGSVDFRFNLTISNFGTFGN